MAERRRKLAGRGEKLSGSYGAGKLGWAKRNPRNCAVARLRGCAVARLRGCAVAVLDTTASNSFMRCEFDFPDVIRRCQAFAENIFWRIETPIAAHLTARRVRTGRA